MWLDNRGVVIMWVSVWVWVSVLCWGGGVQELGSDAYKCEDTKLCFEIVFTVIMIPYQAGLTN